MDQDEMLRLFAHIGEPRINGATGQLFMQDGRRAMPLGSAVLLSMGRAVFLFTARHALVAGGAPDEPIFLALPGLKLRLITGPTHTLQQRTPPYPKADRFDLAVMKLDEESMEGLDRSAFLTLPDLDPAPSLPGGGDIYQVLGFPGGRGSTKVRRSKISATSYSFLVRSASPSVYRSFRINPRHNLALLYDERRATEDLKRRPGMRPNPPGLRGMSGCGVWQLWGERVIVPAPLVGILLEYHLDRNLIIAARVAPFVDYFCRSWPEFAEEQRRGSAPGLRL